MSYQRWILCISLNENLKLSNFFLSRILCSLATCLDLEVNSLSDFPRVKESLFKQQKSCVTTVVGHQDFRESLGKKEIKYFARTYKIDTSRRKIKKQNFLLADQRRPRDPIYARQEERKIALSHTRVERVPCHALRQRVSTARRSVSISIRAPEHRAFRFERRNIAKRNSREVITWRTILRW